MRMTPDQFVADPARDVIEVEPSGFSRDLGMQYHLEEQIAQFFAQICVVLRPDRIRHFVGFLEQPGGERLVRLLAVPRTTAGGAKLRDDLAEAAKTRSRVHPFQIRQSER